MEATVTKNIDLLSLKKYSKLGPIHLIDGAAAMSAARQMAEALRIKSGLIDRHLTKHLTGGNQQKVVIAKWLLADPDVLLLDEPTRGIDVGAKYEVYGIINELAERGTGVFFISSELDELMGMCDRILVMSNGQIQAEFPRAAFDEESILQAAFQGRAGARQGIISGEERWSHE